MTLTQIDLDPETLLERQFTLPALPELAVKLLRTLSNDLTTAGEVARLIGADPGLAAEVLKVVNSAYYGLALEVRDIKTAVAYLGLAQIHRVVMVSSVVQALAPAEARDRQSFWFHSFYTALVAKRIAGHFDDAPEQEELYAAGLLHDVGKLVYVKLFPEHFREITTRATSQGQFMCDAERELGQPSHLTLGVLLCDHWRLPASIRHACEAHELGQLRDGACVHPVQRIIAVANLLVHLNNSELNRSVNEEISIQVKETLQCSEEDFLLLMGEVYDLEQEVGRFLEQL
jgi:HD-like signal output (HDOD) protein